MDHQAFQRNALGQLLDENGRPITDPREEQRYLLRVQEALRRQEELKAQQTNPPHAIHDPFDDTHEDHAMARGFIMGSIADPLHETRSTDSRTDVTRDNTPQQETQEKQETNDDKKHGVAKKVERNEEKSPAGPEIAKKPEHETHGVSKSTQKNKAHSAPETKTHNTHGTHETAKIKNSKASAGIGFAAEVAREAALPVTKSYLLGRVTGDDRISALTHAVSDNKEILKSSVKDAAIDISLGLVPGGSSYQLGKAAYAEYQQGNYKSMAFNGVEATAWGIVDAAGLIASAMSLGTAAAPVQGGIAALKTARFAAKAVKYVEVAQKIGTTARVLNVAQGGAQIAGQAVDFISSDVGQIATKAIASEVTGSDDGLKNAAQEALDLGKKQGAEWHHSHHHDYSPLVEEGKKMDLMRLAKKSGLDEKLLSKMDSAALMGLVAQSGVLDHGLSEESVGQFAQMALNSGIPQQFISKIGGMEALDPAISGLMNGHHPNAFGSLKTFMIDDLNEGKQKEAPRPEKRVYVQSPHAALDPH